MTGRRGNRRRGNRRRGRQAGVSKKQFRFDIVQAPVKQPTVNRSFSFSFTCMAEFKMTESIHKVKYSVESVLAIIMETIGLPTDWATRIKWTPHAILSYGVTLDTLDSYGPVFNKIIFDSLTGTVAKIVAVAGTLLRQPSIGIKYPLQMQHPYDWDGTASTSAPLVAYKSGESVVCTISTYFIGAVEINKDMVSSDDFPLADMVSMFAKADLDPPPTTPNSWVDAEVVEVPGCTDYIFPWKRESVPNPCIEHGTPDCVRCVAPAYSGAR